MIETKALCSDDWPLFRDLRLAALAESPNAFGSKLADWQGAGDQEHRWRARLGIPGSLNLIAYRDGQAAGMASGVPVEGGPELIIELISLWVSPAGRGHGVADRLLEEIERWAVKRGARTICLAVRPSNSQAIRLYERQGFGDIGCKGDHVPEEGTHEMLMAKAIAASSD
ncbi:acyl-CoA N-acyltransferase [Fimicolochytrium jonesii]|uniref:acyl-CoA N-acyltransferase n=1 Tax=Fimicolochytrium jonesii TaxID=1396493 RepID=UPI0022FECE56|nr:acyl-CoA N-acyltransferase [Fimicolochytrium jonesii]KAI8817751.1 acyl-CoA N-acyltransferase [Fimicolochytrium jonesii]